MLPEPDPENAITPEELSEVIAEVTGASAEGIERGAEAIWIEPPEEAEVVDGDVE